MVMLKANQKTGLSKNPGEPINSHLLCLKDCDMYTTLLTNLENNIFTITVNRPDKLNAINKQVMDDLNAVMDDVNTNKGIRSVIITGSGTKAFIAGADIS